ncbi:MAG: 6-carboxytetrahydropterin synthase [Candidatus Dadabacteria bacterium]|nr:MAG: 6-carboxytetrahydropterin synthase [Candidatus Dadabacteria bacterium]
MQVRLGRQYRFFAAHRLYNPALDDAENLRIYGKCSHPNGHGHTYLVDVVVSGPLNPDTQMIVDLDNLDECVNAVLDTIAHKQIEVDVPELAGQRSTTENVARYLFDKLDPETTRLGIVLERVEVAETRNNRFVAERAAA